MGSSHRLGSSWGDFDGDALPDVLISSHFYEPPTLFRNIGGGRFQDATQTVMEAPTNLAQCVVPGEPVGPWGTSMAGPGLISTTTGIRI